MNKILKKILAFLSFFAAVFMFALANWVPGFGFIILSFILLPRDFTPK